MRVRDLAAELISEIADELGYLVYKYECSMPSCGNIVFEKETESEAEEDEDTFISVKRYKILDYQEHQVFLWGILNSKQIDLHDPDSVEDIREWFEDLEDAHISPYGYGITGITGIQGPTGVWPSQQPVQIQQPIQPQPYSGTTITITDQTIPYPPSITGGGVGWSPNPTVWCGTTVGSTINSQQNNLVSTARSKSSLFSFNSFGSLPLGP